jgi:hypothetical protein
MRFWDVCILSLDGRTSLIWCIETQNTVIFTLITLVNVKVTTFPGITGFSVNFVITLKFTLNLLVITLVRK